MRIDARVSKLKFELEIERLGTQTELLKKRGIVIDEIQYPVVKAIFIPRSRLNIHVVVDVLPGFPALAIHPGMVLPLGKTKKSMISTEMPTFAARAFGVRISLDDFDQRAPSVVFCDPFTWEDLPDEKLHHGSHIGDNNTLFPVILRGHPLTKKPFLCMRGIREYHDHPQHSGDEWIMYRKYYGLCSTLDTVWKTCVHNANPNVILQPPYNIQVNWTPDGVK